MHRTCLVPGNLSQWIMLTSVMSTQAWDLEQSQLVVISEAVSVGTECLRWKPWALDCDVDQWLNNVFFFQLRWNQRGLVDGAFLWRRSNNVPGLLPSPEGPGCWGAWGWRTTGRQCREPDGVRAGSQSGTHPKGTWLRRPYQGVPSSVSMTKSRNTTVVQLVCGGYLHTPTFAVLGQCRHIPGHQEKD